MRRDRTLVERDPMQMVEDQIAIAQLRAIGAVVIAIIVSLVLGTQQRTAYESFATEGVRVGDPGHNLVGPDWSGAASAKGKR